MNPKDNKDNPFSKLQEENEAEFDKVAGAIKSNVEGRRGFWTLVGDIIDLYVPKVIGTLFGGNSEEVKNIEAPEANNNQEN